MTDPIDHSARIREIEARLKHESIAVIWGYSPTDLRYLLDRVRALEADRERIRRAILVEGPRPDVHRDALAHLRESWPRLWSAIAHAIREPAPETVAAQTEEAKRRTRNAEAEEIERLTKDRDWWQANAVGWKETCDDAWAQRDRALAFSAIDEQQIREQSERIETLEAGLGDALTMLHQAAPNAFANGNEHNGIDEGEYRAGQLYHRLRALLPAPETVETRIDVNGGTSTD